MRGIRDIRLALTAVVVALLLHAVVVPPPAPLAPRSDGGGIARVHDADAAFALPGKRVVEVARPERTPGLTGSSRTAALHAKPRTQARVLPLPGRATPPRARSDVHRVRPAPSPDEPPTTIVRS